MKIPVYNLTGELVCHQYRSPGRNPIFMPRGVKIQQCRPYIERLHAESILLFCEGPTDAMALGKLAQLSNYSIIAAWSASTIPSRDWWNSISDLRIQTVVACGDNDAAGKSFNQRIANLVGECYQIYWPPMTLNKWDMKDEVDYIDSDIVALIGRSLARGTIKGLEKQELKGKGTYASTPGLITRLVEEAGGRLAFTMQDGAKYYCPLHDDREDASLTVNDKTGAWKCWSSCCTPSQGGPPQWLMAWKGIDRKSAMELLKKYDINT